MRCLEGKWVLHCQRSKGIQRMGNRTSQGIKDRTGRAYLRKGKVPNVTGTTLVKQISEEKAGLGMGSY